MVERLAGFVIKAQSGFFTVEVEDGRNIVSQIAGRLKKERKETDLVATGDKVVVSVNADGSGLIESVSDRERVFSRARPLGIKRSIGSDQEQVWVANPDQAIIIFSVKKPDPSLRKLDRYLVVAEMNELPAIICVNKIDLGERGEAQTRFSIYEDIGYLTIYTSAVRGDGVGVLKATLKDKITVFVGSSGVGKTSLLNVIQPGFGRRVQEISSATEKGLHTTRYIELHKLEMGGYVADTPGIRSLALYDLEPGELDGYFREIAPLVSDCQFSDCTHKHEPNCAVIEALARGQISNHRYDSYLRLREEHEQLEKSEYE